MTGYGYGDSLHILVQDDVHDAFTKRLAETAGAAVDQPSEPDPVRLFRDNTID